MRPPLITGEERRAIAGDWLLRLQSDELEQHDLAAWLDWYSADAQNAAAFEELQSRYEALREVPREVRRRFANELSATKEKASRPSKSRYRLAVAAALGLMSLGILFAIWRSNSLFVPRPLHTAAYQTRRAHHENINLPDGSQVKLGALSSISMSFTADARFLVLEGGEAFFDVARDPSRPFVVQVGGVTVRALGTSFNIRRAEDRVVVAVSEGVVEVGNRKRARVNGQMRVAAGQQVSVNPALASASIAPVRSEAVAAWQRGRLEFVNEPLSSVIATVNRYSDREIVVTDRALATSGYTGTVNENRIEEWLSALPVVFPVRVTQVGRDTVLLSAQK